MDQIETQLCHGGGCKELSTSLNPARFNDKYRQQHAVHSTSYPPSDLELMAYKDWRCLQHAQRLPATQGLLPLPGAPSEALTYRHWWSLIQIDPYWSFPGSAKTSIRMLVQLGTSILCSRYPLKFPVLNLGMHLQYLFHSQSSSWSFCFSLPLLANSGMLGILGGSSVFCHCLCLTWIVPGLGRKLRPWWLSHIAGRKALHRHRLYLLEISSK